MQLELNAEETEKVLLEWAEKTWPGIFKSVDFHTGYNEVKEIVLSSKEKEHE